MDKEFSSLLDSAFSLHTKGLLDEAKVIYEKILSLYPEDVDTLNLYAQLLVQFKNFDGAISIFEKIYDYTKLESIKYEIAKVFYFKQDFKKSINVLFDIKDKTAQVFELIASNALKLNDINLAIDANLSLLELMPVSYSVLFNVSVLYFKINKFELSLDFAYKALNVNNSDINLYVHFASVFDALDDKENLILSLEKILEFDSNNERFLLKLALEYFATKKNKKAVLFFERCIKINPYNYEALIHLSKLMLDINALDIALNFAIDASNIQPDNVRSHHSLFKVYMAKFDYENAKIAAKKIVELKPDNDLGYGCLGDVYFEYIDFEIALNFYDKALEFSIDDLTYLHNKVSCLAALRRYDEALEYLEKIFAIDPNYYKAIVLKAFILLKMKKYSEAMKYYYCMLNPDVKKLIDSKQNVVSIQSDKFKKYYSSNWNREDLSNKTLLLYRYEGYGDSIMFSRYIPLLESKVKKLIIEVDKNLYKLYKENFKGIEIVLETDKILDNYDYTTTFMELFYNINQGFDLIPDTSGWLSVETNKKNLKINTNKKKVAFFWQGNKEILKNRFMNILELIPLFELSNIQFYSLDITEKEKQTIEIFEKYNIIDCKQYINDFYDTASIIKNMDLVITIDSSIVHLAGALGVKTYLMLPAYTEWRWSEDSNSTIWYDSVRIFKQKQQAHWFDVISDIKKELLE